jgi:hypothetical protein
VKSTNTFGFLKTIDEVDVTRLAQVVSLVEVEFCMKRLRQPSFRMLLPEGADGTTMPGEKGQKKGGSKETVSTVDTDQMKRIMTTGVTQKSGSLDANGVNKSRIVVFTGENGTGALSSLALQETHVHHLYSKSSFNISPDGSDAGAAAKLAEELPPRLMEKLGIENPCSTRTGSME